METMFRIQLLTLLAMGMVCLLEASAQGQCGPTVPSLVVDLSSAPNATFLSPSIQRNGQCCGVTAPDQCLEFIITLHPDAQGIHFDICAGAVPPGALFYQIGCGPPIQVGQPICLDGPGPHVLTFCKPGNNSNQYCITSVPAPSAGPGLVLNDGCTGTLTSSGFAPGTIQWTSIEPGPPGAYNGYLACPTCANTQVTGQAGAPAYVDYQVCGNAIAPCSSNSYCDTVRVYFNPTLTAVIVPEDPVVCFGAPGIDITVVGDGGTPPYSYLWSTGETSSSIFVGPGTYTVTLNDASNCPPATAQVVVNGFANPITASAGDDILVCGQSTSVPLNGSVTGVTTGIWSGGQGVFLPSPETLGATYQPTPAEIAAGFVQLTLTTTGNGPCPGGSDVLTILFGVPFFGATIEATNVSCQGAADGTASFAPADPELSYLWNDPAGQTTATANGLGPGAYTVFVTDALGCDTSLTITITEPAPLNASFNALEAPVCSGDANGSAGIDVSGGTAPYTYAWWGTAAGQSTPQATGMPSGAFGVTITDANGCSITLDGTLQAPPPVTLTAQVPDTVCVNVPVTLTAQAGGGSGGYVITWAGIGTGSPITHLFQSNTTVTVTVQDAAGCAGPTLSFPVSVLDLQSATLTTAGGATFCPGAVASVSASLAGYPGDWSMSWPQLGSTGPGPHSVVVIGDSLLHVIVTDGCGQQLAGTVQLLLETPPVIQMPPVIAEGCAPFTLTLPSLVPNQPLTYHWNLGNGGTSQQATPTVTYPAGTFGLTLTVYTPAGCTAGASTTGLIIVHPPPVAQFTADPWVTDIDHATIDFTSLATGQVNGYAWSFGDGATSLQQHPTHTYDDIGTFMVEHQVTSVHGCVASVVRPVTITPVYDITVPNVFTPNTQLSAGGQWIPLDLSNDVFYPFVRFVQDYRFRIFNRWGEQIFESHELAIGWDGWYRGQPCAQDVYVWQLWVRFVDGAERALMGDVTLLR
ncbi:MAG: gliding motility-associated C-terminal domain-containing protein [Flavobacteriales bacterium]|nr:gliding motility-associated C-terminal domain-containing protein [Flavobacteriales bacterium]